MNHIVLKIAQTYFSINSENEFYVAKDIEKYIYKEEMIKNYCNYKENYVNFKITVVEEFTALSCKFVAYVDERMSVFESPDGVYEYRIFFNLFTKEPCALYKEVANRGIGDKENKVEVILLRRYFEKIEINSDLLSYFAIEKYLLDDKQIILHSSFIKYNGEAILFTAPSGTGKSTQADLWEKYANAEIINGDRSVLSVGDCYDMNIRKDIKGTLANDKSFAKVGVYAHGLPFCGTSGIDKNTVLGVRAIIYLQQGIVNSACKISKNEIIKKIFSETTKNLWNQKYIDKAIKIIENIAQNVEIYKYTCTKYQDAVEYLNNKLYNKF